MKKIKLMVVLFLMVLLVSPYNVPAATSNGEVGSYLSVSQCTSSKYQDNAVSTSGDLYFSHCIQATCTGNTYKLEYYNTNKSLRCTNGNNQPYYKLQKSGCDEIETTTCNNGHITYCSLIMYYDCSRVRNGETFKTQTQPTKPTYVRPTPTVTQTQPVTQTQTVAPSDTRLKSLTFSKGSIEFKSDVYEYTLNLDTIVNSVEVNAIPVDEKSTIEYEGNTNLKDGSVIKITVKGSDGKQSIYNITVSQKETVKLSNNTRLELISIKNHNINFNSRTTIYTLPISEDVKTLEVDAKPEDSSSVVTISGNTNLKNGSKITITVTAEDGSVGYYYINITVKQKSNFIKILFIIVIILALGAGGFYVYKKFIGNKEGEKYEYE